MTARQRPRPARVHGAGRTAGRGRPRGATGQATVEMALALPLLMLFTLLVVQVGLLVRDRVALGHAARAAARAAVTDPTPAAVRAAAGAAAGLDGRRLTVSVSGGAAGALARVTVVYRAVTDVPLVGPLLPDVVMRERLASLVEGD